MWIWLCFISTIALVAWGKGNDYEFYENKMPLPLKPRDVPLALNGGWYSFQFGQANTEAPSHFVFQLSAPALFKITDYFCSGDRFYLKDSHKYLGPTGQVSFDDCKSNTTNPDYAFAHPDVFSVGSYRLEVGWHNISVKVLQAPFGGGSGAVRLDPIIVQCAIKTADSAAFTMVDTPVPYAHAAGICSAMGLQLADINLHKTLAGASDLAFQCLGPFRKAWIGSYFGNDYDGSCVAMRTLVMSPGALIGIEEDCNVALPVLCQSPTA